MIRRFKPFTVALALSVAALSAQAATKAVVISIDGFRPDFYLSEKFTAPTLKNLARTGYASEGAVSVFPSLTYPNHTSLMTGVSSSRHGVLSNNRFSATDGPLKDWYFNSSDIHAPTLWELAKAAGKTTAAIRWPVTVGATIDWNVPEVFSTDDYFGEASWKLLNQTSSAGLMTELGGDAGRFKDMVELDNWVAASARTIMDKHNPDLLIAHLSNVDHVEHEVGRDAAETVEAVKLADAQIARIAEKVDFKTTCLFIVGDHGFQDYTKTININALFLKNGWLTVDKKGRITDWKVIGHQGGGQAAIYVKDKSLEPAVWKALTDNASAGYIALSRSDLQVTQSYPDAFAAVSAKDGFSIGSSASRDFVETLPSTRGTHGYLPLNPQLRTGFIAVCPSNSGKQQQTPGKQQTEFQPGPEMHLIDVAPTIANALGLSMPSAEGHSINF
ncbi:MAG: alkaline phosphatase family protein [Bdellovibrionales bacterium]|nr:alkaline phosphatase family protein [Bdellovibrionales bacterium]